MSEDDSQGREREYRSARLEAFSDGVFAIAITLLVLDIAVPAGSEDDLWGALGDLWPSYLAYLVSFSTVGAVWIVHTVITEYLDHTNSVLLRLNLLLLMLIALLPFPTKLLAEFIHESDPVRVAVTVYGVNLLLAMVMASTLWRYAVRAGLVEPNLADADVRTLTKRLTPTLGFYVVTLLVGLFLPVVAVVGYLMLALFILIPFSAFRHQHGQT